MDSGKKEPLAALFYEHKPVSMILSLQEITKCVLIIVDILFR